jgi:NADH-quinone oxidoreductase subunit G
VYAVYPVYRGDHRHRRARFLPERVWYLEKVPSICTGCDIGCNITLEHRAGKIRRYKPRTNPEVNDYWMCDYGRSTAQRYGVATRLAAPRRRADLATGGSISWSKALGIVFQKMLDAGSSLALLGSPYLSTEEAFLLARAGELFGSPHRTVWTEEGPERSIPNPGGGISGHEAAPNRRGAELAGLVPDPGGVTSEQLLTGRGAAGYRCLFVADGDPGSAIHSAETVERLRAAETLIVMGWAETPLTAVADVALPCATHAEKQGTFVNVRGRLQRFERAFPPPGEARPAIDILADLLRRFDPRWETLDTAKVFKRLATTLMAMPSAELDRLPAHGFEIPTLTGERSE